MPPQPRARAKRAATHGRRREHDFQPTFLGLPPAVRLLIYEYLFVFEKALRIKSRWDDKNHCDQYGQPIPFTKPVVSTKSLLSVCRTIHDEAVAVLYGRNNFQISAERNRIADVDEDFFQQIGARNAQLCTQITVCIPNFELREKKDKYGAWVLIRRTRMFLQILGILAFQWKNPRCHVRIVRDRMKCATGREASTSYFLYGPFWATRINAAFHILCNLPVLRRYWESNLLAKVDIDANGTAGTILFKMGKGDELREQKFRIMNWQTAPKLENGSEEIEGQRFDKNSACSEDESDVDVKQEEIDFSAIEELVHFENRRATFSELPGPVMLRILQMVVWPPQTHNVPPPTIMDWNDTPYDSDFGSDNSRDSPYESWESDDPPTESPDEVLDVFPDPPLTLDNFWCNEKMKFWVERLWYQQNTFDIRFELTSDEPGKIHEFPRKVGFWLHGNDHRQFASGINVIFAITGASLEHFRINTKYLPQTRANVNIQFFAQGSQHITSVREIEQSVARFRAKRLWTAKDLKDKRPFHRFHRRRSAKGNCVVDGYGEVRSFDVRHSDDVYWTRPHLRYEDETSTHKTQWETRKEQRRAFQKTFDRAYNNWRSLCKANDWTLEDGEDDSS